MGAKVTGKSNFSSKLRRKALYSLDSQFSPNEKFTTIVRDITKFIISNLSFFSFLPYSPEFAARLWGH